MTTSQSDALSSGSHDFLSSTISGFTPCQKDAVENFSISTPIIDLSLRYRLATIYSQIEGFVDYGGLMAYSPDAIATHRPTHRRAANYVDRILKGTSPADLPVEEATTFDFAINLTTAKELGLTIPQDVLVQATRLIE